MSKKNEYKQELIDEIVSKGEKITFYTCGTFTDLCRGGHLKNPAKVIASGSFRLDRVAGAYWHGNEKNKMLTRIYGLAFETKEELEAYVKQREEAEKRDHKKLGKELGYNDFPNSFEVEYELESARERGRNELIRIMNSGRGRLYVYPNSTKNPDYDLY